MVAQTIQLPNIRKMFLPDPGKTMIEVDLARADAQAVAWEAQDDGLKEIFRRNKDIHTENALAIFGGPGPLKQGAPGYAAWDFKRHRAKIGVHAVNYGCKAATLAEHLLCTTSEAARFIASWFAAHPLVLEWHKRVEFNLKLRGCVENIWGYKRHYFDRLDGLLPEALGWIGQSTIAITINKILLQIEERVPEVEILLQVHDSVLFQVPTHRLDECLFAARLASQVVIPYPDPLIIPPTFKMSEKSWGDCRDIIFPSGQSWRFKEAA